jgi:G:T-mismatch repair DNA endonuclease (very short patch repair protein)
MFGEAIVKKTVEDYQNQIYCIYNLPIDLAKYLFLLGLKRSSKEERQTSRYKLTYTKSIQQKYGSQYTNISQVKEIQNKKAETCARKHGSYDKYLESQRDKMKEGYLSYLGSVKHKETIKSIEETCLSRYNNKNFGQGEDARIKAAISRKDSLSKLSYEERLVLTSRARASVCHRGGYSSKPEKRVRKALIDLNIEAQYNRHMWHYNWDLVFDRVIIEVQGTMWHAKPDRYKATDLIMGKILVKDIWDKDKKKKLKAEKEGYTLIEIWEDEINSRTDDQLQSLIKERLSENGIFYG